MAATFYANAYFLTAPEKCGFALFSIQNSSNSFCVIHFFISTIAAGALRTVNASAFR
jgi:hypothetical protein